MTTKTINGKEILFVQVPIWAKYFKMGNTSFYCSDNKPNGEWGTTKLLDASLYRIIGLASNLTEDEWKGIVEISLFFDIDEADILDSAGVDYYGEECFRDYMRPSLHSWTASQSGQSLLQSLNLNLETTLIIENK